ncbi:hypothetical protein MP638_000953 [Amoeboaphelidium occidentale]|nr:hypothetical protein MP638_000953 [Amoeboaphelidium occidentale]
MIKSSVMYKISNLLLIVSAVSASEWFAATVMNNDNGYKFNFENNGNSCVMNNMMRKGDVETAISQSYYAAPDDSHPDVWWKDLPCEVGPNNIVCPKHRSCGKCVEVACIGKLDTGNMDDTSQFVSCRRGKSVVLKIVDVCPSKHPVMARSEPNLCASKNPHLDVPKNVLWDIGGSANTLHVMVRKVDCSVGLGIKGNGFTTAEDAQKAYRSRGDGKAIPASKRFDFKSRFSRGGWD